MGASSLLTPYELVLRFSTKFAKLLELNEAVRALKGCRGCRLLYHDDNILVSYRTPVSNLEAGHELDAILQNHAVLFLA